MDSELPREIKERERERARARARERERERERETQLIHQLNSFILKMTSYIFVFEVLKNIHIGKFHRPAGEHKHYPGPMQLTVPGRLLFISDAGTISRSCSTNLPVSRPPPTPTQTPPHSHRTR